MTNYKPLRQCRAKLDPCDSLAADEVADGECVEPNRWQFSLSRAGSMADDRSSRFSFDSYDSRHLLQRTSVASPLHSERISGLTCFGIAGANAQVSAEIPVQR